MCFRRRVCIFLSSLSMPVRTPIPAPNPFVNPPPHFPNPSPLPSPTPPPSAASFAFSTLGAIVEGVAIGLTGHGYAAPNRGPKKGDSRVRVGGGVPMDAGAGSPYRRLGLGLGLGVRLGGRFVGGCGVRFFCFELSIRCTKLISENLYPLPLTSPFQPYLLTPTTRVVVYRPVYRYAVSGISYLSDTPLSNYYNPIRHKVIDCFQIIMSSLHP